MRVVFFISLRRIIFQLVLGFFKQFVRFLISWIVLFCKEVWDFGFVNFFSSFTESSFFFEYRDRVFKLFFRVSSGISGVGRLGFRSELFRLVQSRFRGLGFRFRLRVLLQLSFWFLENEGRCVFEGRVFSFLRVYWFMVFRRQVLVKRYFLDE